MSRIIFVLLVILAVFSAGSSGQECGLNEEFKPCGTACEPLCNTPQPVTCIAVCVIGCQCKAGYVRKDNGSCIHPNDC